MKTTFLAAMAAAIIACATGAFAHSGGTDANGCHTNHKTGAYHCH
ncbi:MULTISPECIES: YHYH domain-containing protein [Mesorhizobium]